MAEVTTLIAPTVNLLILIGALVYFLREPFTNFVRQRHLYLRDELESVRNQLMSAQTRYNEFSSKLAAVEGEINELRQQAKRDAESMKTKIVAEAQRLAVTIQADARGTAAGLLTELKGQLYTELSARILERADAIIRERLTGDDRARIRQEFSRQVESVQ